jgi:hypothetical protein
MKNKWFLVPVVLLVVGFMVVGCDNSNGEENSSSGDTGTVLLTNSSGTDLRKLKITNGGKQVKYDEVVSRNANYPNVPRGLCTISFDLGLNGKTYSHNFTVGSGERVSINFTSNYNFVITRSGGNTDPVVTDTGSIRLYNSSGYSLYSVTISQNNKVVKDDPSPALSSPGNKAYTGIPVGECEIRVSRYGGTRLYWWNTTVTVNKGTSTAVNIPKF